MNIAYDWKRIVKRARSFHLAALAFVFEGISQVLPLFIDEFPRNIFAGLTLVALAGSMWARVIRQKGFY